LAAQKNEYGRGEIPGEGRQSPTKSITAEEMEGNNREGNWRKNTTDRTGLSISPGMKRGKVLTPPKRKREADNQKNVRSRMGVPASASGEKRRNRPVGGVTALTKMC